MEKLVLEYPVFVEGKYDKIKLDSIVASPVFALGGFSCFNNKQTQALIRRLSSEGAIILTDSDKAGSFIRSRLKGYTTGRLINLYTPAIHGKEKRKTSPSKEGLLGVEGMDADLLRGILLPYTSKNPKPAFLDKKRLFADGLSGTQNSARLRSELLLQLGLPSSLTSNAMCDAVNSTVDEADYIKALEYVKQSLSEGGNLN